MLWKLYSLILVVGCLALPLTPCRSDSPPCPPATDPEMARRAIDHFWKAFRGNDYAHVDDVIEHLTAAQSVNTKDATVNFLLGGAHLWKFQERGRANRSAESVGVHA